MYHPSPTPTLYLFVPHPLVPSHPPPQTPPNILEPNRHPRPVLRPFVLFANPRKPPPCTSRTPRACTASLLNPPPHAPHVFLSAFPLLPSLLTLPPLTPTISPTDPISMLAIPHTSITSPLPPPIATQHPARSPSEHLPPSLHPLTHLTPAFNPYPLTAHISSSPKSSPFSRPLPLRRPLPPATHPHQPPPPICPIPTPLYNPPPHAHRPRVLPSPPPTPVLPVLLHFAAPPFLSPLSHTPTTPLTPISGPPSLLAIHAPRYAITSPLLPPLHCPLSFRFPFIAHSSHPQRPAEPPLFPMPISHTYPPLPPPSLHTHSLPFHPHVPAPPSRCSPPPHPR